MGLRLNRVKMENHYVINCQNNIMNIHEVNWCQWALALNGLDVNTTRQIGVICMGLNLSGRSAGDSSRYSRLGKKTDVIPETCAEK